MKTKNKLTKAEREIWIARFADTSGGKQLIIIDEPDDDRYAEIVAIGVASGNLGFSHDGNSLNKFF